MPSESAPLADPDIVPNQVRQNQTLYAISLFLQGLTVTFGRAYSGNVRRFLNTNCFGHCAAFLAPTLYGSAMGYKSLSLLAEEYASHHSVSGKMSVIIKLVLIVEFMALDGEITSELPEELTANPALCEALQLWLPIIGQPIYDQLVAGEDQQSSLYRSRYMGKPFLGEPVVAA